MSRSPLVPQTTPGIAALSAFIMLSALVLSCKRSSPRESNKPVPPPQVVVAQVIQKDVPIYSESVGTTQGFVSANILPKISGYLLKQDYQDGSHVSAGRLLFQIDDRPYKAALDQAAGNLAQAQAQLKQNQQDLARYTALFKAHVIPKQTFDTATQTTRASKAQVEAASAALESAKVNLEWTKVYSPIDGVAGIAQAQVGDLVSPSTLLTTISQLHPIKVSFPISESEYLKFATRINARENGAATTPGPRFELILGNGAVYGNPGKFYAANRQVDVQTGTIQIQAVFANPEDILRPGMYAKVRVQTGVRRGALLVPQAAVFEIQGQYQIATVGDDNRVTIHTIKPGSKVDGLWLINEGVKSGERVVTEGVQKVKDGMEVKPVLLQPSPQATTAHPASTASSHAKAA